MSGNPKEKSRPSTGTLNTSRPPSMQRKSKVKKGKVDLQTKEEEYRSRGYICWYIFYYYYFRRLNEELESKAAFLLQEADDILVITLVYNNFISKFCV